MKTFDATGPDWAAKLASAIGRASDGDKILVSNEDTRKLAERAIARSYPEKEVNVEVKILADPRRR